MQKTFRLISKWFVSHNENTGTTANLEKVDWLRTVPFILLNLSCLLVFWVGFSWVACITAIVLYYLRTFSISAFYHRYFSHKTYKTNRFWQFVFAVIGVSAAQRGPLWWAAHHRHHHQYTDHPMDEHSPVQHGFWWSHVGWFLSRKNYYYDAQYVRDLAKFPELVFLTRYDNLVPAILLIGLFFAGSLLNSYAPALNTSGLQMVVWGFCLSTVAVFHTTVTINSISHMFGKRRYITADNSRNIWWLAIITFGEGWHNNHHHYPNSARQGFRWYEIDISYYILKLFEKMGIISDLKGIPNSVLEEDLA